MYKKSHIYLASVFVVCILFSGTTLSKNVVLRKLPRSARMGLVVLNFKNTTPKESGQKFQPWEYGIPAMLMTDIESMGLFNILSRERLKDILDEQALQYSGVFDPKTAVKLGKLIAAQYILTGSFMEINGKLRIDSQVFSVENGTQLGAASVVGKTNKFFEIEKELVFKISSYLKAMLTEEEKTKIAMNIETRSIIASLNNYAGEIAVMKADDLLEQGKSDEADEVLKNAKKNFQKALKHDPKYKKAKRNFKKLVMGIPLTL